MLTRSRTFLSIVDSTAAIFQKELTLLSLHLVNNYVAKAPANAVMFLCLDIRDKINM